MHPPLSAPSIDVLSLGQQQQEKSGGVGVFVTVLLMGLSVAVGYAIGFERGATAFEPGGRRRSGGYGNRR